MSESAVIPKNPFRILDSFEKTDEQFFHGRDNEIDALHKLLMTGVVTLVFGESGVGKTSLVRCTLARKFDEDDYLDIWVRRGTNMTVSLRSCLMNHLSASTVEAIDLSRMRLYKLVKEAYHEYFKPVYLIFDQFEDLYIFGTSDERNEFYTELEAIVERRLNCKVVIVIREDYHGALQDLETRLPGLYRKGLRVFPLDTEFARTNIIDQYLEASGARLIPDKQTISKLIADNCTPLGHTTIFLPYLGVFLYKLWERASNSSTNEVVFSNELVEEVGKIGNVLRGYLSDVIDEICLPNKNHRAESISGDNTDYVIDAAGSEQIQIWAFLQEFVAGDAKKCAKITDILSDVPYETKHRWAEKLKEKRILNEFLEKDQYELAHQSLAPIILEKKNTERRRLSQPLITSNPYKGLLSYEPEDNYRFFGRDKVADDLFAKVLKEDLVAVVGASGTGKSSLVKAGVIPRLEKERYALISIKPGAHPSATLRDVENFLKTIDNQRISLLYVDQFEELSTRCEDTMQRKEFIKFIKDLIDPEHGEKKYANCKVLLSVRGDFEFDFDREFPRWTEGKFNVPKFLEADFRKAIVEPAYMAGLEFKPAYLVDVMISEVLETNALPLLSYALSELYNKYESSERNDGYLTELDYNEIGGVKGSLGKGADKIYYRYEVDDPMRRTIRNIMLRMTSIEFNTERAGKPVLATELEFISIDENNRVKEVLEQFTRARLIVTGRTRQSIPTYEPAHDSLVRTWGLINDWVRQFGRDIIYLQSRLRDAVKDYKQYNTLWHDNNNLSILVDQMQNDNWFNRLEMEFIEASLKKKKELEKLREREQKFNDDQKKNKLKLLAVVAMIIAVTSIFLYIYTNYRNKELKRVSSQLALNVVRGDSARVAATQQARQAMGAQERSEMDRMAAVAAEKDAQTQKELADKERIKVQRSLNDYRLLTSVLKLKNDSLKIEQKKGDSTLQAFRALERTKLNAEKLGRWLQLISSYEANHPVLAYRIAQKAVLLDPANKDATTALRRLSAMNGYIPVVEIRNTFFSTYANNSGMFLTTNNDSVSIWNANGKLRKSFRIASPFNAEFSPSDRYLLIRTTTGLLTVIDVSAMKVLIDSHSWEFAHFTRTADDLIIVSTYEASTIIDVNGRIMEEKLNTSGFRFDHTSLIDAEYDGNRIYLRYSFDIQVFDFRFNTRPFFLRETSQYRRDVYLLPCAQGCIRFKDGAVQLLRQNSFEWDTYRIKDLPPDVTGFKYPVVSADCRKLLLQFESKALLKPQKRNAKQNSGKDDDPPNDYIYFLNLDNDDLSRAYRFIEIKDGRFLEADISDDGRQVLNGFGQGLALFEDGKNDPIFFFDYPFASVSFNPVDNTSFMARSELEDNRTFIFHKGKLADLDRDGKVASFDEDLQRLGVR